MRSVQLGTYKSMIDNVVGSYTGYIQIHENGYWDKRSIDKAVVMTDSLMHKVSNTKGVEALLPRLENYGLLSVGDLTKVIALNGLDFEKEQKLQDIGSKLVQGTLPKKPKDIIIGKGVASYFKAGVRDTVVFMGQGYHGMLAADKFQVSGILDFKNPTLNKTTALMSLNDAQNLFSANGIATSLVIDKENNARLKSLQAAISSKLDDSYEIMNWQEMMPELQQTILADSIGGLLMVAILYMILIFGIFGTVLMMTQERKYEFGVLVSIGMKKGKLMLMVFMETIILSLLGVLAGVLLAYPIMLWKHYDPLVLPGTEAEMMETFGFSAEIPFYIQPDLPLVHTSLIFSIALLVSLYPIAIIKKLRPLEAMRG
ncbi:FtsX-like permease family protein [Muricauda sp. SCSIO 65647]|nr:FtsX-like permease family protein [Muricauda sp. SCSIO 65647]